MASGQHQSNRPSLEPTMLGEALLPDLQSKRQARANQLADLQSKRQARANQLAAQRGIDNSREALLQDIAALEGQHFNKPLSPRQLEAHACCISLLERFLGACGFDASLYLAKKDALPISDAVWHRYAKWFASQGMGRVRSVGQQLQESTVDPLRASTVAGIFWQTVSARKRLTNCYDVSRATSNSVIAYIASKLTDELHLETAAREKNVGTPIDFEAVLSSAYTKALPFKLAEERLAFTASLKILAYTASRPGELLHCNGYDGVLEDGLRWSDVELHYLVQQENTCTIAAKVTIRLLKGQRFDKSAFKRNVLLLDTEAPLLCPVLDLLALAEIQDVLETSALQIIKQCFNTSGQHQQLPQQSPPLPPGTRIAIAIKQEAASKFIFRKFSLANSGGDVIVADQVANQRWLGSLLQKAGHAAGFVGRHTAYTWRRMSANAINRPSVTEESRKALMGHGTCSTVFRAYLSRTSVVDVQGLLTGKGEQREAIQAVERLSSGYELPNCISVEGRKAVFAHDQVQSLTKQMEEAKAAFYANNAGLTIRDGLRLCSAEAIRFTSLQRERLAKAGAMMRSTFEQELHSFVKEQDSNFWSKGNIDELYKGTVEGSCLDSSLLSQDADNDAVEALQAVQAINLSNTDDAQAEIMAREPLQDTIDALLYASSDESAEEEEEEEEEEEGEEGAGPSNNSKRDGMVGVEASWSSIMSSAVLQEDEQANSSTSSAWVSGASTGDTSWGSSRNTSWDSVAGPSNKSIAVEEEANMEDARLMAGEVGEANEAANSSTGAKMSTASSQAWQQLPSVELSNRRQAMVSTLLKEAEQPLPLHELLECLIDSNMLVSKPFRLCTGTGSSPSKPASEQLGKSSCIHPLLGCYFCSATDLPKDEVVAHRQKCQLKHHVADWIAESQLMKNMQSLTSCPCPKPSRNTACGKIDFSNTFAVAQHLWQHLDSRVQINGKRSFSGLCPFPDCNFTLSNKPAALDMRIHFQQEHQVLPGLQSAKDLEQLVKLNTFHCDDCKLYFTPHSSWREHCNLHRQALLQQPKADCYRLVLDGPLVVKAGRCPFCLHDDSLPAEEALFSFSIKKVHIDHMQCHLINLAEEATSSASKLHCPICKKAQSSVKDLGNHLVDAHELGIFGRQSLAEGGGRQHWDGKVTSLRQAKRHAGIRKKRAQEKRAKVKKGQSSKHQEQSDSESEEE